MAAVWSVTDETAGKYLALMFMDLHFAAAAAERRGNNTCVKAGPARDPAIWSQDSLWSCSIPKLTCKISAGLFWVTTWQASHALPSLAVPDRIAGVLAPCFYWLVLKRLT